MHENSLNLMRQMLAHLPPSEGVREVLDVGSRSFNGSYRELIESLGMHYVGLDIEHGENVDIISLDHYNYPIADAAFDVVISGSTAQNVYDLQTWMKELFRIVKPGGMVAIVAPTWNKAPTTAAPEDLWRFMPAGLCYLFTQTQKAVALGFGTQDVDVWCHAFRKDEPKPPAGAEAYIVEDDDGPPTRPLRKDVMDKKGTNKGVKK